MTRTLAVARYADTDGDGKLTLSEPFGSHLRSFKALFLVGPRFVELIRQMRIGVSTEAAAELFTMLDVDFNGRSTGCGMGLRLDV